jgi:outer membrane lipase/esterase
LTGAIDYSGGTVCATPNQYLFWDELHPTAAGHAIIADAVLPLVTPEPASSSLITVGLLGMGIMFRRRRG